MWLFCGFLRIRLLLRVVCVCARGFVCVGACFICFFAGNILASRRGCCVSDFLALLVSFVVVAFPSFFRSVYGRALFLDELSVFLVKRFFCDADELNSFPFFVSGF